MLRHDDRSDAGLHPSARQVTPRPPSERSCRRVAGAGHDRPPLGEDDLRAVNPARGPLARSRCPRDSPQWAAGSSGQSLSATLTRGPAAIIGHVGASTAGIRAPWERPSTPTAWPRGAGGNPPGRGPIAGGRQESRVDHKSQCHAAAPPRGAPQTAHRACYLAPVPLYEDRPWGHVHLSRGHPVPKRRGSPTATTPMVKSAHRGGTPDLAVKHRFHPAMTTT